MEGKGIYTIMLSIIAVLSVALAGIIIFLVISWGPNKNPRTDIDSSGQIINEDVVIPDDQIAIYDLFAGQEPFFNLKAEPEHPEAIIMLKVSIKCDVGKKRKDEEQVTKLINELYLTELREAVAKYFLNITYTEANQNEVIEKAREDLKVVFNDIVNSGSEEKQMIVYRVNFEKRFVQ